MEIFDATIVSAFFDTPNVHNKELYDSNIDEELYNICIEMEKCEMYSPLYDMELYNICASVETKFK